MGVDCRGALAELLLELWASEKYGWPASSREGAPVSECGQLLMGGCPVPDPEPAGWPGLVGAMPSRLPLSWAASACPSSMLAGAAAGCVLPAGLPPVCGCVTDATGGAAVGAGRPGWATASWEPCTSWDLGAYGTCYSLQGPWGGSEPHEDIQAERWGRNTGSGGHGFKMILGHWGLPGQLQSCTASAQHELKQQFEVQIPPCYCWTQVWGLLLGLLPPPADLHILRIGWALP